MDKSTTKANTVSDGKKDESLHRNLTFSPNQRDISLPPLLNNNAFVKQYNDVVNRASSPRGGNSKTKNALPIANQSKIKQVIDELYHKEKRYVK